MKNTYDGIIAVSRREIQAPEKANDSLGSHIKSLMQQGSGSGLRTPSPAILIAGIRGKGLPEHSRKEALWMVWLRGGKGHSGSKVC